MQHLKSAATLLLCQALLGLPVGLEAPVITPKGATFSPFLFFLSGFADRSRLCNVCQWYR